MRIANIEEISQEYLHRPIMKLFYSLIFSVCHTLTLTGPQTMRLTYCTGLQVPNSFVEIHNIIFFN